MKTYTVSYVSKGLEQFDAVFYLPIYNAFLIGRVSLHAQFVGFCLTNPFLVLGIVCGAVYFNESRDQTPTQLALFSIGVAITIGGVFGAYSASASR